MHIHTLLVEDSVALADTIMTYFGLEKISCDFAATGKHGLDLAVSNRYDVILLDINLPKMDGLEVCDALRRQGIDVPVLMLTARDTLEDKLAGFEAGTDDYLVKPFDLSELTARIKALAKRRSSLAQKLEVGPLMLDLSTKIATREGQTLALSPTGWKLLELLMRESPNVVSRERLMRAIWEEDATPDSDVLKVQLYRLRQQVDKPYKANLIHTIAAHGVAVRDAHE